MEATFKVTSEEFTPEFYEWIKGFLSIMKEPYLSISLKEESTIFSEKLIKSRFELENRNE